MIALERLQESDFPTIIEWVNKHPEDFLVQWSGLTYVYPLTLEQMQNHYSRGINTREAGAFVYKIMNAGRFIGTVQLCRFDWANKEAVIGRFLIAEQADRGKGVGKSALNEVVKIGFREFELTSMKLNVYEFNEQAIRCYESVGFRKRLFRENVHQDQSGAWWNSYEMILTIEEWNNKRRNPENG